MVENVVDNGEEKWPTSTTILLYGWTRAREAIPRFWRHAGFVLSLAHLA
jgi:hypothetical protein